MAAMSTGGAESAGCSPEALQPTRYESRKRRDWQTFTRYLTAHRPPLELRRCSGAHVLEFLRYLDRFGKTRVHAPPCPAYGGRALATAAACQCPFSQAWGSLDALVGRLRAAFDERHGRRGSGEQDQLLQQQHDAAGANPFAARAVTLYLRDVRVAQAKARGISYHKKRKAGNKAAPSSSKLNDAASEAGARARGQESRMIAPPLPPCSPGCRSSAVTSEAPLEEELIMPASTAAASTCHVPSVKDNWS